MHILITGGAGFIGSHLADDLIARGHRVRALDNLAPQVHGHLGRPSYLHADVELISGDGRPVPGHERPIDQLREGYWEVRDGNGVPLVPLPTPESKQPALSSVYALSKYDQERMCLMVGRAYNIPTVALRFFNVFGTRQS